MASRISYAKDFSPYSGAKLYLHIVDGRPRMEKFILNLILNKLVPPNWIKNLILFTLCTLRKSRIIDITSDPWIRIAY